MDSAQPPLIPHPAAPDLPPSVPAPASRRRNSVTVKLLFIAGLVLLLQLPLRLINELRQERSDNRAAAKLGLEKQLFLALTPYPSSASRLRPHADRSEQAN